ncbi:MAG: DUF3135 domain-containing protein [Pseudomonadota bacterium]
MADFDFDAWRDLAVRDPEAYFRERDRAITAFIAAHPESAESLHALQAHIDKLRALSGSPMIAAREMARLMGQRLESLARHLNALNHHTAELHRLAQRGPR